MHVTSLPAPAMAKFRPEFQFQFSSPCVEPPGSARAADGQDLSISQALRAASHYHPARPRSGMGGEFSFCFRSLIEV